MVLWRLQSFGVGCSFFLAHPVSYTFRFRSTQERPRHGWPRMSFSPHVTLNQRAFILICALGAMAETLLFTAVAPMLETLDAEFGLSAAWAGLLVAGYAIGYWFGAYPAYRCAARLGSRMTATVGVGCVASASFAFAVGDSFSELMVARLLIGFGSVATYTGLLGAVEKLEGQETSGRAIGFIYTGSVVGSAFGPFLGSLSVTFGREPVFLALAVGQVIVATLVFCLPSVPNSAHVSVRAMSRYLNSREVGVGLWICSLPGFALGILTVAGTYRLVSLGTSPHSIALAFSGIALIGVFLTPQIGKWSDRVGRRRPTLLALGLSLIAMVLIFVTDATLANIGLIAIAGAGISAVAGPGLALVGDAIRERGGDSTQATFLMNLCWGPAAALGAILAGQFHGGWGGKGALLMLSLIVTISILTVRMNIGEVSRSSSVREE